MMVQRTLFSKTPDGQLQNIPPAQDEDFHWGVDVCIRGYLDTDSLSALRANRESMSKEDSNGDLFIRILTLFLSKPLPEQVRLTKPQNMQMWLIQTFGCTKDHVGRLLQVIRSQSSMRDAIMKYCQTRYGAVHFRLTWASQIVLSSLDFIWERRILEFVENSNVIFGHNMQDIPSKDWEVIVTFLQTQSRALRDLSLLFFPTVDAFADKSLNKKFLQLPASMVSNKLPELTPFKVDGNIHTTRRPEFLECLSDTKYCGVFTAIMNNSDLKLPSWKEFTRLQTEVSSITCQMLHHIMVWYDQNWEFPKKADERRKNFQWAHEFEQVVLRKSTLIEGGARGYGKDSDLRSLAEDTVRKIWDIVENDRTWKQKSVVAEVEQKPESSLGVKAKPVNTAEYCSRFDYTHWAQVLQTVRHLSGPALSGFMARFNETELDVSNKSATSFGILAMNTILKDAAVISQSCFLCTHEARSQFTSEFNMTGILTSYRILKGALIRTIEQGFNTSTKGKRPHPELIDNEAEWQEVLAEVQHLAALLTELGCTIDVDDINEGTEGERRPGLLGMIPTSEPLPPITPTKINKRKAGAKKRAVNQSKRTKTD